MTTDVNAGAATPQQRHKSLETTLPVANFISYFAIAAVEFAVPFVAVATLGATSLVIAALGICRFAPQVLLARTAALIVERYDQRTVMLGSELLRVVAFLLSALALVVSPGWGLAIFALANIALACGSILTSVSTQVLVPAVFADKALPKVYARLGIAESSADGLAPFLTGLGLGALGVSPTFGVAAALAACACALLLRIPRIRVPADEPEEGEPQAASRTTLRRGLRYNLDTPPLRIITIWAVSYNLGQCIIEALLLIALLKQTPITAASYGVIRTCAVLFAVLGAYLAERLPTRLRSGLGTSIFGCGAVAAYAVTGIGAYLGGMTGLALVIAGFMLDEFCSGVALVRIQTLRARTIAQKDRAIATAAYRALNLTAVPVGFALGGLAGLFLTPASILLAVGLLMLLPALLILSRSVRTSAD
ncbi:MFS transporter [Streptomyces sp. 8L]|uniref:MFS transporter n=1 Tax=Streptomyces sp. 8L TaxID=2877242 RepID=UPI001CD5B3E1|nr:MFS transporter [Streptomyces sp. 8L]MCA1221811.1 MFS transporter [Streptomyces sp. 8L]